MDFNSFSDIFSMFKEGNEEAVEPKSYEEILEEYEKYFSLDEEFAKQQHERSMKMRSKDFSFKDDRVKGGNITKTL